MKHFLAGYARLISQNRAPLAFGFLHAFLSSAGQTFFIALFVTSLGAGLGLSVGALGAIYLAATLAAAAALPLIGQWIDRVDLRIFSGAATLGLGLACLIMAMADSVAALCVAIFALRLTGQGLMIHIEAAATARYFGPNRGAALSLTGLGLPAAEAMLPTLALAMILAVGWQYTYAAAGLFILLICLPVSQLLLGRRADYTRPPAVPADQGKPTLMTGLAMLAESRFVWLALPLLLYLPFTSTALLFHIQPIADAKAWPLDLIASAFIGFALLHAVGLLFSGRMVDRFSARRMTPLLLLPLLLGIGLVTVTDHWLALYVLLALAGFSTGVTKTVVSALWAELFGISHLGAIRSAIITLMVGATAAGPAAFGGAIDLGVPLAAALGVLVAIGALATALAVLALRWRRPLDRAAAGGVLGA